MTPIPNPKPKKRKGEIREDYYGTWFIILKEGHDERWVGRLLPEEFERVMSGEKYYSERCNGLLYKRGKKILLFINIKQACQCKIL